MTYENSTTPNGADAPAPPPWLQFAPPPTEAAPAPQPAPQPPANDGRATGLPPAPDRAPSNSVPTPGPDALRPPETAPADPVAPETGAPPAGPVDAIGRHTPPPVPPAPEPGRFPGTHQAPDAYAPPPGPTFEPGPTPPFDQAPPPAHQPPPFPQPGPPGPGHPAGSVPANQLMPPGQFGPGTGPAPTYPAQQMPPGYGPQGAPSLDEVALIRKARRAPSRGWRRAVHTLSAGAINPGESQGDIAFQQLLERVNRPVRGDYRIAVLSLKGGVGKTTTTVGLGSTFASLRGDRVIAVDANPDLGTLAQRIPQQTRSTVRDLLADQNVYRYSDVRAHTSQAPSRLEVLASERDPAMAEAFNEEEYRGVVTILQRFYNIIITDCGTGLSHSAMNGVLDLANTIILVSSPALDGARSAGATLDWLEAHGFGHLVSRAVVVLSSSRPGSSTIDTDQLGQHFLTRCRAVHKIPFDDHLAEGADVDLELMSKPAKRSFVELAATIADDFSGTTLPREEPYLG
ncbi:MinD/ParA family ATP-binding protein [Gordonia westfalica]|uniref:MinD-like ATPase involved in chromosome partitioning or flagellar assembly n=1 Tax=Gordonia westfalica TaxID=158898 RepID=A0A1H2LVR9_9ACTN|nr:MinD/ParA family protein [Gordonia westfalica]SDU84701.1 MinD-like ATPase involved in chromosome partitioning or flagellar assembly [Gordonia westfalica]